ACVSLSPPRSPALRVLPSFPTRRSSDLGERVEPRGRRQRSFSKGGDDARRFRFRAELAENPRGADRRRIARRIFEEVRELGDRRSEEHTSELQSLRHLVCRLLLEKKKKK